MGVVPLSMVRRDAFKCDEEAFVSCKKELTVCESSSWFVKLINRMARLVIGGRK